MLKDLFDSAHVRNIFNILKEAGAESRFVGGCVRDTILNIATQDIDIATTCTPEKVESLLKKNNIKSINIGKDFGTVIAVIEGHSYEITTLRKDVEFYNGRHAVVEYTDNWHEDAERRDFTFNAMSYCPYQDKLFDYFSGKKDLSNGVIRFIGKAEDRVKEDYLRILRFFRFYSYHGKSFEEESILACTKYAERLSCISAERKWQELYKILLSERYVEVLELMMTKGILEHVMSFPVSGEVIEVLKSVKSASKHMKHFYTPIFVVSIISRCNDVKVGDLKKSLSLTSKDIRYISSLYKCLDQIKDLDIEDNLYQYLYQWRGLLLDALIFMFVLTQRSELKSLYKDAKDILDNNKMDFPVNGHDIIKNFPVKENDKKIGKLLDIGKRFWCKNVFKVNKSQIIDHIKKSVK